MDNFRILLIFSIFFFSVHAATTESPDGYIGERKITTADGDVNAAVEQYNDGTGKMVKTLVAMRIPYAQPPLGDLRYKPPQPASPWSSPLNVNRHQGLSLNLCPQVDIFSSRRSASPYTYRQKRAIDPTEAMAEFFGGFGGSTASNMSEDCLHLNVWAPLNDDGSVKKNRSMAVMVFVHGGGFTVGSSNFNVHEGSVLSMATGSIVVTLNYRLGALGFLHYPEAGQKTANLGLMDQTKALKWVQANIEAFGGDPSRVTVFGESAGSASVHFLMISPMSQNLFQKAVLQSGVASNMWAQRSPDRVKEASAALASSVGCPPSNGDVLDCLRGIPATTLANMAAKLQLQDHYLVPTTDFEFFHSDLNKMIENSMLNPSEHEIMFGFNRDEGSMFVPDELMAAPSQEYPLDDATFDASARSMIPEAKASQFVMEKIRAQYDTKNIKGLIQLLSDSMFRCGIVNTANAINKNGGKVNLYLFDEDLDWAQSIIPIYGAAHSLELQLLFGRPFSAPHLYSDSERVLSGFMMKMWGDFANDRLDARLKTVPNYALVLSGRADNPEGETVDMTKCEFLGCLEDLVRIGEGKMPNDMACMDWAQSGAAEPTALLPLVVATFSMVLTTLLFSE